MAEIINWPCNAGRVSAEYFLKWTTRSVGVSLAGHEQIVAPNAAVWEVTITFSGMPLDPDLRQFEARVSRMRGRFNVANLCLCGPGSYDGDYSPTQTPFSDGTWFADGTGHIDSTAGAAPVVTTAAAAAGANSITVDLEGPPVIPYMREGHMFSVNGFLYRVVWTSEAGAMGIEPPLREAIPSGTTLQTDPPHFYGRFASDNEGRAVREWLRWSDPVTIKFIEAFDR